MEIPKKIKANESGQILILVMLLIMVGGLILPPLLSLSMTGISTGYVFEKKTHEYYAAESGIQHAIWIIENNQPETYPYTYQLSEDANDKSVTVTIERVGVSYKVTSTATTESTSNTTVEAYLVPPLTMYDLAAASLEGDLTISGKTVIESWPDPNEVQVYSGGNILLEGKVEVQADVTAGGSVTISGGSSVTGYVNEYVLPLQFQELDTSGYLEEADAGIPIDDSLSITESRTLGPTHISGDLTISASAVVTLTGTVWVDGNIQMSGSSYVEGAGTMVAVGNIEVTGGGMLEPDNLPIFISTQGSIMTAGNQQVSAILYAPNGDAIVSGTAGIFGSLIGKTAIIETSSTLGYPIELRARGPQGELEVITWKID